MFNEIVSLLGGRVAEELILDDITTGASQDIKQATALPIQFSEQSIKDPPDNPDGTVPPNQQVYKYFTFSVSTPYSPQEWKVFFEKFYLFFLLFAS